MLKKLDLEIQLFLIVIIIKNRAIRSHGSVWKYKGEAFVNDKKMADAIWSATIVDKK